MTDQPQNPGPYLPKSFHGNLSIETYPGENSIGAHEFLERFERVANVCKWSAGERAQNFALSLTGAAYLWVKSLERCVENVTWGEVKTKFLEAFQSSNYKDLFELRLRQ